MSEAFGTMIREAREGIGSSQRDLAAKVGIDFTYLSKIERGVMAAPSEDVIRKLATELNIWPDHALDMSAKVPLEWGDVLEANPRLVMLLRKLATRRLDADTYQALIDIIDTEAQSA